MEPRRLLTAVSASFDPNGPNHSLVYDFDTDVSASLVPADIEALDLKSATRIAPADTSLAFAAGDVATLALGGVTYPAQWGTRAGLLADGNYEAILSEAAVSPPLNDEHRLNFHFYQGDIVGNNGAPADRTININDQSVLFSHWNQPGNYLDGDLNYDGTINFGDYAILASRWGSTLHAPLAAPYAVQVGSQTTDSLLVEWTAPQWPGGATPDGYRIYRSEDGVDFGSTFVAAVPHTPGQSSYAWEDTDLLDGRKYWYRIRAYTTAGGNTHTTEKRWGVTTLKAPTYVTLSYNDDETEAVARWRGGSSHHTGYTVKLYEAPAEDTPLALMTLVQTQQVGASETSHTFTLPQGEHGDAFYFAVVQARNAESSADSAPNVPARAQHDPTGPWTSVFDITHQFPHPFVRADLDWGEASNPNRTATLTLTNLPRHTYADVYIRVDATGPAGTLPQPQFTVTAGDTDVPLPLTSSYPQYGEKYFYGGIHPWVSGDADAFKHDSSSIEIKIEAAGFTLGWTWSPAYFFVETYFPFVSLASDGGTIVEDGTGQASFTATRDTGGRNSVAAESLTVYLEDRSGEVEAPEVAATWGEDFELPETIEIPGGEISKTVNATALDDFAGEGLELISMGAAPSAQLATTRAVARAHEIDEMHCGPDVTSWFVEELNIHASFWRALAPQIGLLLRPAYFHDYAANIPYKWTDFGPGDEPEEPQCANTVTVFGKCIDRSELGNIMFGYVGREFGISDSVLLTGAAQAGAAGPNSPEDIAGIVAGFGLAILDEDRPVNTTLLEDALEGTYIDYIDQLEQVFEPGSPLRTLLEGLNGSMLSAISGVHSECNPSTTPATLPHATFAWIDETSDIAGGDDDWSQSYPGWPITWPN